MEPALAGIAAYEYGQSRQPLAEFDQFVRDALSSRGRLDAVEQRLIKLLQTNATLAGKDVACRHLSVIGGAASIPVLAPMLLRPDTSEMARYALERIPTEEADGVLRDALAKATGKIRIGIVNSLGARRDAKSVPSIQPLLESDDVGVVEASAAALGRIGGPQALQVLAAARKKVPVEAHSRVAEAYLQCAAQAPRNSAARIAKEMSAAGEPVMIRIAALGLLASVAGRDAVPVLAGELNSNEGRMQAAAVRLLGADPSPEAAQALLTNFPKASAAGQVRILAALADHGGSSARTLISGAVAAAQPEVRVAALSALGTAGDPASVTVLAEAAANREGVEQSAARESLYRLRGREIDPAVVAAIDTANGKVKVELIRAAGERGIAQATDALLRSAVDSDRDVRRESLRALRDTASPSHAPALLELVLAADNAGDRRDAGRTLASVLKKTDKPSVDRVISAYASATAAPVKASLVDVLGQVAVDEALPTLRSALKEDAEISRAAILALSDWPTPAPMPDLVAVARSDRNPAGQVLALRGYIKLAAIPGQRPASESVRLLAEAMGLAKRPEEKKAILAVLPAYPSQEALQLAEASLKDENVVTEAKTASDRIRGALNTRR
jgi:HEAT repeat protein